MAFEAPEYLSASSIGTFLQCPLRFKYTRIDGIREPPTQATLMGNFVHDILELLYQLPQSQRSVAAARGIARSVWDNKYSTEVTDYVPDKKLSDFRWQAWFCVENLWQVEDPQQINFEGLETEVDTTVSGVRIRGFIDRFSISDSGVAISDYKTGKVPGPKWRDSKFFQLLIYAALVEELDIGKVNQLQLVYLKDPVVLNKSIQRHDIEKTIEKLVEVKSEIDKCCKNENFIYQKSRLCDWCSFKAQCPAWNQGWTKNER